MEPTDTPDHPWDAAASAPPSASSLRAEHAFCERLERDLVARAESGDWQACDRGWDRFSAALQRHMCGEERSLFPRLAAASTEGRAVVEKLREEHVGFRRSLNQLGIAIELHELRLADVEELVRRLREHAAEENRWLYPWADEILREHQASFRPLEASTAVLAAAGAIAGSAAGAGAAVAGAVVGAAVGAIAGVAAAEPR